MNKLIWSNGLAMASADSVTDLGVCSLDYDEITNRASSYTLHYYADEMTIFGDFFSPRDLVL